MLHHLPLSENDCCAQKLQCRCIRTHCNLPTGAVVRTAGQVHAMLSLVRGKPTTTESVKLLLTPLEDPSMAVRCAALQKLREVLRSKREWLAQLLADSTTAVNQDAAAGETKLLAALTEALLKSCNAEVHLQHVCRLAAMCLLPGQRRLISACCTASGSLITVPTANLGYIHLSLKQGCP